MLVRKASPGRPEARYDFDPPIWFAKFDTGYWQNGKWHPGYYSLVKLDAYDAENVRTISERLVRSKPKTLRIGIPYSEIVRANTKEELISAAFFLDEYAVRVAAAAEETSVLANDHVLKENRIFDRAFSSEAEMRRYVAGHSGIVSMPREFVTFCGFQEGLAYRRWRFSIEDEGWVPKEGLPADLYQQPMTEKDFLRFGKEDVRVYRDTGILDRLKSYAMSSFASFSKAFKWTLKLNHMHSWVEVLKPDDHFGCSSTETLQKASQTVRIAPV